MIGKTEKVADHLFGMSTAVHIKTLFHLIFVDEHVLNSPFLIIAQQITQEKIGDCLTRCPRNPGREVGQSAVNDTMFYKVRIGQGSDLCCFHYFSVIHSDVNDYTAFLHL